MRHLVMLSLFVLAPLGWLVAGQDSPPRQSSAPPAGEQKLDDSQRLATAAAKAFYHNIRDGKAAQNMALFYMPDISIGVIDRWPTQTKWAQHTPAEYLRQHGDEPKYFEVDTVDTQVVHEELAVARVSWRAGGVKGVSVITLTGLDGKWRIASLFEETAFVW